MNCNMIISPWKSYRSIPGSRLWDHTMLPMERILTLNKWSYIFKLHHFCGFSPVRFPLWWALILSSIHYLVNSNNLDNHSQITLSSLNSITSYDFKMNMKKIFLIKASNTGTRSPLLLSRWPQYVNEISDICKHFQAHGSGNLSVFLYLL